MRNVTLLLSAAAGLVSLLPTMVDARVLRGDAFITAMEGNTLTGKDADGQSFKVYFVPGGQATIQQGSDQPRFGSWSLNRAGDVCVKWPIGVEADAGCFTVQANGSTVTWSNKDGTRNGGLLGEIAPLTMSQGQ